MNQDNLNHTDKYKHCNHHHELTENHKLVDFGDGEFVANVDAIPLLEALAKLGIRTRTHHVGESNCFVSILIEPHISLEIKQVNEIHANRTKYNGMNELLIQWTRGEKDV